MSIENFLARTNQLVSGDTIETLQRELGASLPLIESLETELATAQSRVELLEHDMKSGDYETLYAQTVEELASERAANARLQELHTGLMKNADNMNDALRAANAKVRQDTIEECAQMCELERATGKMGEHHFKSKTDAYNAACTDCAEGIRALGEAVPVQQDLTDGECYKTYAEKISGDPDADDDEHLLGLRAVIAAARKRNL